MPGIYAIARAGGGGGAGGPHTPTYETLVDGATVAPDGDNDGGVLASVSQATQFSNPTGSAPNGWVYVFRVSSVISRALTWDTQYRGSSQLTLPVATSGSNLTDYFCFQYNSAATKWDYVAENMGF